MTKLLFQSADHECADYFIALPGRWPEVHHVELYHGAHVYAAVTVAKCNHIDVAFRIEQFIPCEFVGVAA